MSHQPVVLRPDTAFTDPSGERLDKLERQQTKHLAVCRDLLAAVLEPGEDVLYIAPAVSPFSTWEFLTTGWILMILKRSLLAVTDRRLLHVPLTVRGASRRSIAEIRYAEARELKVHGVFNGVLDVVAASGRKERFSSLPRAAKKKLAALLAGRANPAAPPAAGLARHFLCPRCRRRWAGEEKCGQCGLAFKNGRLGFWMALLAPGGGYFYTGHPWLGIGDALAEMFLLVLLLLGIGGMVMGEPDSAGITVVAAGLLALEKLISVYHTRHFLAEALPAEASFRPGA